MKRPRPGRLAGIESRDGHGRWAESQNPHQRVSNFFAYLESFFFLARWVSGISPITDPDGLRSNQSDDIENLWMVCKVSG